MLLIMALGVVCASPPVLDRQQDQVAYSQVSSQDEINTFESIQISDYQVVKSEVKNEVKTDTTQILTEVEDPVHYLNQIYICFNTFYLPETFEFTQKGYLKISYLYSWQGKNIYLS